MSVIHIRRAGLDDTEAISRLFRAGIQTWQRIDADGRVQDIHYDGLSIYERWLHGGAWMSIETGVLLLSHLLRGAGLPLVAIMDNQVVGYIELYLGDEPEPMGRHLHIAHIMVADSHPRAGQIVDALLKDSLHQAKNKDCARVTVSFSGFDTETAKFYAQYGMSPLEELHRYAISAQTGQGFYKMTEHLNAESTQIAGWQMVMGRVDNARYHWEHLWTRLWDALSEVAQRPIYRLRFAYGGTDAFLCAEEDLYNPRSLKLSMWSPKPLTSGQVTAIRDWAYRQGYRTLTLCIPERTITALKIETEVIPFKQVIYAVDC